MLVVREHDFELSPPRVFRDLIRKRARHAASAQSRNQRRAYAVEHQAWRELNRSRGRRTGRGRKGPGAWNMGHRDDLVLGRVRWLLNAWMIPEGAATTTCRTSPIRVATIEELVAGIRWTRSSA